MRRVSRFLGSISRGPVVGLLCGLVAWVVSLHPLARGLEDWCQDASFAHRGVRASACRVALVALDEPSLRAIPKPLAFSSDELARVVGYLIDHNVLAVGLDVMIPEDLDDFPGLGDAPAHLGEIAAGSGRVVLPSVRIGEPPRLLRPLRAWRSEIAELPGREFVPLGLVGLTEDDDHFVRRQAPRQDIAGRSWPQFTLAMLETARQSEPAADGRPWLIRGRPVPVDASGRVRINFVGPTGTIPRLSFRDVLAATVGGPEPRDGQGRPFPLAGAYVIIGATAATLGDLHVTPYSNETLRGLWSGTTSLMPGPEIHANLLATLDDGAFIVSPWWVDPLPTSLLAGVLLGIAFSRLSLGRGALLAFCHHFAWKGLCLIAFLQGHWRVEMIAMLLTGGLCFGVAFALRWRVLRNLFGIVKGESIARALENDPGRLRLKGELREVSVLFADIRDFTSFSESRPAQEVVSLLNAYFAVVVPAIEAEGGVLDKYIGDGIMAIFGAPDYQPDHAFRAARAASVMAIQTREHASTWSSLNYEGMKIGIGVQTGMAVVGTVGSPGRMDYTAIGATVNTASRIESATKSLHATALIGAATREALSPFERARLGISDHPETILVKGMSRPVEVYRLADKAPVTTVSPKGR